MRCPRCKKKIPYPTQRQLLAFVYRRVYEYSEKETAEIMGVTPNAVRTLLQRMGQVWPQLLSISRKHDPVFYQFNEELHSEQ